AAATKVWRASPRSPSVVLPMAETTTTSWLPGAHSATRRATFAIFSASATDDPPYFLTSSAIFAESYATRAGIVKVGGAERARGRLTASAADLHGSPRGGSLARGGKKGQPPEPP